MMSQLFLPKKVTQNTMKDEICLYYYPPGSINSSTFQYFCVKHWRRTVLKLMGSNGIIMSKRNMIDGVSLDMTNFSLVFGFLVELRNLSKWDLWHFRDSSSLEDAKSFEKVKRNQSRRQSRLVRLWSFFKSHGSFRLSCGSINKP